MWLSWSYTVFLGIWDGREKKRVSIRWRSETQLYFPHPAKKKNRKLGYLAASSSLPPTCRWQRVSRERSLSRLLALSFCGLLGWRSFNDVLRPRLPANLGSCLCGKEPEGGGEKRGGGMKREKKKKRKTKMNAHNQRWHCQNKKQANGNISQYLLDEMMRDSVLVILPLGGSLSRNVSMLSISSSVVGVTASGCS